MIYVAAGRHVYHQPLENLRYVHGLSLDTAAGLPIPPRRAEPEGCPDHPLRGVGFKFGPFSDVNNPGTAETAIGGLVQLIEIDPASSWDTHERYSLSNPGSCPAGDRGASEMTPGEMTHGEVTTGEMTFGEMTPGLTVCWSAAAGSADRGKRSPFVALVDSRHYTGPLGQPLAVLCNPNMSADADDYSCELSYRIDRDVILWYDFRTSLIPLSGLIDFDRELRRRIAQAEVPDYGWPSLSTSRPAVPTR
jgi:hypothetical protein